MTTTPPKGVHFHVSLLLILLGLVGALRLGFGSRYSDELKRLGREASLEGSRQKEAVWLAHRYVDATGALFAGSFLTNIDWRGLDLPEPQATALRDRLGQAVRYLQNPTFEEYYRLRTEGLEYRFGPSRSAMRVLTNCAVTSQAITNANTQELCRQLWKVVHLRGTNVQPPRLAAVCLDNVAVALSVTNTPWSLLSGKVAKGLTVAAEAVNPGFEYRVDPALGGGDPAKGTFVHLSFLAKLQGSTNAGPIYISLCWLPKEQQWGLSRMIADTWLGMKTVF